ncbi:hypothetical protein PWT90_09841 [Aphanocladium album]|nr:hypothetical protein PWT90_09841 [Aphanocladium album]
MHDSATGEPPALANEEYTVGWICALYTEYIAAQVFLDEIHAPSTGIAKHDNNDYVLGRIGRHNVAIAVMPGGEYGTASAAVTATDMLHTFTNVRIGLMVGIGGGAPSAKNDIRLGDIVVSVPQNGLGGVFQYDFGKTIQDQPFQATRFLAPPPRPLLSAINGVRAEHEINGHTIQEDIEACLAKKTRLKKKFSRPDSESDRLYSATTIHQAGEESCLGACDIGEASIISRRAREEGEDDPAVHYGLIASANNLMKDAHLRDQYAAEKNVLCFEMEAGGLMNQFPCIVIRGICDYSDTHKNKDWQGYAAMTAAAYAKDLIKRINSDKLQAERKIIDVLESYAYLARVIKWLSSPDPSTNLNKARELHQHGTGQWLLDSDRYQSWTTTPSSFLWLYGIPGCGKTILSSTVVTNLQQQNTCSQGLLYFYFDFSDVSKRSTENAIRSLICQLYLKEAATREILDSIYETSANTGGKPGIQTLSNTLKVMLDKCVSAWIVLDGLDECETRDQHGADGLMQWIKGIRSCKNVHLLVTSRPEQDIKSSIEKWANEAQMIALQSSLVANDIEAYIDFEVNQMDRWHDRPAIQGLIKMTLKNKADGMFRWVACQFDILDKCLRPADIRAALATLPHTLDDTYKRILQRLPQEYKPTAPTWKDYSSYTFWDSADQVMQLRMQYPFADFSARHWYKYAYILESSNEEVHETVKEYYNNKGAFTLGYTIYAPDIRDLPEPYTSVAPLYYASCTGLKHSVNLLLTTNADVNMKSGCYGTALIAASIGGHNVIAEMLIQHGADVNAREIGEYTCALVAALDREHEAVAMTLVQNGADANADFFEGQDDDSRNERYWVNALQAASYRGYQGIVEALLKNGAEVNTKGGVYGTALIIAAQNGFLGIVRLLLQYGADINATAFGMGYAIDTGYESSRSTCDEFDEEHGLLFKYSPSSGGLRIAATLTQDEADVNSTDGGYGALAAAADAEYIAKRPADYLEIVKLLIQEGACVNKQGGYFGNALQTAAKSKFHEAVETLIQHGADVNAQGGHYGNALQAAAWAGCQEVAETLIQHGADVNAQGGCYGNALQAASEAGHKEVVEALILLGANVNAQGARHGSALLAAVRGLTGEARGQRGAGRMNYQWIVETLVRNGADVNVKGGFYGNALQAATAAGCKQVVEILIEHGADVHAQGGHYGCALHAALLKVAETGWRQPGDAVTTDHVEIATILIQNGAKLIVRGGISEDGAEATPAAADEHNAGTSAQQ